MACVPDAFQPYVRRRVVAAGEAYVHEEAVIAVGVGFEQRFVNDRDYAFAVLAGALCDELFDPESETRDLR